MSQYGTRTDGSTATVTDGSAGVVIAGGTLLGRVKAGQLFTKDASGVPYYVASDPVDDINITLTANWNSGSASGMSWHAQTSRTTNLGLDYPEADDIDQHTSFKSAMNKIDSLLFAAVAAMGIVFGTGSALATDATNFAWNDTENFVTLAGAGTLGTPTSGQAIFGGKTTTGASIRGYGSTYDVTIANRAGTTVIGVGPNSTAVAMAGTLSVGGNTSITGTLSASNSSGAQGIFSGYASAGLNAANGRIQLGNGATNFGYVEAEMTSIGRLTIGQSYDAAGSSIAFRVRTSGTPVQPLLLDQNGATVTGTGSFSSTATATRFIVTGAPLSSEVAISNYSGGLWLNTPSATSGYLGVNGSGILQWASTGVAVTGTGAFSSYLLLNGVTNIGGWSIQTPNQNGLSIRNAANNAIAATFAAGGNVTVSGSGNYAIVNGTSGILLGVNGTQVGTYTSTGLAVTGVLSTTGIPSFGKAWEVTDSAASGTRAVLYNSNAAGQQVDIQYRNQVGSNYFGMTTTGQHFLDLRAGTTFLIQNSGSTFATFTAGGGLQMGAPTGGDKGAGTINVAGDIYKNNTAYTNPDYVLEHWATGKIEKFADKAGASEYAGLMQLDDLETYLKTNLHLPRFGQQAEHGLFSGSDALLASVEEAHLYILQLKARIAALESRATVH